MSLVTLPYTFTNGTPADATQVDADFNALVAIINGGLDSSNLLAGTGIFASQIIPMTTAQATFGGSIPYVFPQIVNAAELQAGVGATGMISGDISLARGVNSAALFFGSGGGAYIDYGVTHASAFTITGATNGLFVPNGNISATNSILANIVDTSGNSAAGLSGGDIRTGRSAMTGALFFGTGLTRYLDFNLANTGAFTFNGGALVAPNLASAASGVVSVPSTYVAGDIVAQRNDHQGVVVMGGAANAGGWDYNINNGNALSGKIVGGGYAAVFGGTYTNASDRRWKKNIRDIEYGLEDVLRLRPRSFDWRIDSKAGLGFIAQEAVDVLPQLVTIDASGDWMMSYEGVIPVLVKAMQELTEQFRAYAAAHP